ncbi:hypothetical protein SAMN05444166_1365 [Singulisphaera sp. GP187]|nr:hypothetical protein SAMN05444166_1365 [Singulisphaera sp. GP187]
MGGRPACNLYLRRIPYTEPWVMLLRRVWPSFIFPHMILLYGIEQLLIQSAVPFYEHDFMTTGLVRRLPRLAAHLSPMAGDLIGCESVPLSGFTQGATLTMTLDVPYEGTEPLSESEWERD